MNAVTKSAVRIEQHQSEAQLSTEMALLFHTRRGKLELTTVHACGQRNGRVELEPGKPLSPDQEMHIVSLMLSSGEEKSSELEFIPVGVLVDNPRFTIWFIPESKRVMHFHDTKGRRSAEVYWPNQVLMARDNKLFVAAVKGNARPTAETPLYYAPLCNIWDSTELCVGNADIPHKHGIQSIAQWEAVLFDSAFSHANNRRCIANGKGFIDPMEYWQSERAKAKFSAKALVPTGVTLGEWLSLID